MYFKPLGFLELDVNNDSLLLCDVETVFCAESETQDYKREVNFNLEWTPCVLKTFFPQASRWVYCK